MAILQPPPLINIPLPGDGYTALTTDLNNVFPNSTLDPSSDTAERLEAAARGLIRAKSRFQVIKWTGMEAYSALLKDMHSREQLLRQTWNDVVDNVSKLSYQLQSLYLYQLRSYIHLTRSTAG